MKSAQPDVHWQPRKVFLFSGHMMDAPDRATPRFPLWQEPAAAQQIARTLDRLGTGPDDLALTQGACGGDLLFTEACLQRGVKVHWLQPFPEPDFIRKSVACCGDAWYARYLDARSGLAALPRSVPDEPGDRYERCNLLLLDTALAYGADRVHFICLWNGGGGDGPGGTAHMYEEVKRKSGQVTWIDTRKLDNP